MSSIWELGGAVVPPNCHLLDSRYRLALHLRPAGGGVRLQLLRHVDDHGVDLAGL